MTLTRTGLGLLLSAGVGMAPAIAGEGDPLTLFAGISSRNDDNLFRLPSGADTNSLLHRSTRSDTVTVSTLGIKFDKRIGLQRFELQAGLEDNRYRTFDYLDFTARNYAAAWHWSLTPSLHGTLRSDRRQTLNDFVDYSGYNFRNIRTDKTQRFDGVLDVSGAWHFLGGVSEVTRTNSETFSQEGDSRLTSVDAGIRRDLRSGTSIDYVVREGRGEYFNRPQVSETTQLDNGFDQREQEIHLNWLLTGKTTVDARVTHVARKHAHFSSRDYSGTVGRLGIDWKVTDKTSLQGSLGRELTSYQSQSSSYITTDRLILSPVWQMTAKTALRGRLDVARRAYGGAIAATSGNDRSDTLRSVMLALEWRAQPGLGLTASIQNDRRTSNVDGYDYASTMVGVAAQLNY